MDSDKKTRRSVTEKLRSNHIDTLEVLQSTQDENEDLKDRVQKLQERLESFNKLYSDNYDDEEHLAKGANENKELLDIMQKNKELSEELAQAKEKIKQYQLQEQKKALASRNSNGTMSAEELQQVVFKMRQKEYQDSLKIKELEKSIEILNQTSDSKNASYEAKLKDNQESLLLFQEELRNFQNRYNEMKNDLAEKTQQIANISREKDQLTVQLQYFKQQQAQSNPPSPVKQAHSPDKSSVELYHLRTYERDLKNKNEEIELKNKLLLENQQVIFEKDQKIQSLTKEVETLEKLVDDLKEQHVSFCQQLSESQMQQNQQESNIILSHPAHLAFSDSECESLAEIGDGDFIPMPAVFITPKDPAPRAIHTPQYPSSQAVMNTDNDPAVAEEMNGNIRFQEFMKLKLENRELKLRLAELTSHQYNPAMALSPTGVMSTRASFSNNNLQMINPGLPSGSARASFSNNPYANPSSGLSSKVNSTPPTPKMSLNKTVSKSNSQVGLTSGKLQRRSIDLGQPLQQQQGIAISSSQPTLSQSRAPSSSDLANKNNNGPIQFPKLSNKSFKG